jgi:hypothetical protein
MSPQFLVIAYYTENTPYEALAANLKKSLQHFGIAHHIEGIKDLGSWEKNTHHKAHFIKKCLTDRNQDLLCVDVDAVFKAYPDLIPTLDCDIAYRTENFRWRKDEALSGTIFLRNNDKVKRLVDRWIELNEATPAERMKPETWEQKNMQRAQREISDIVYYNLPPEYTYIFDHTRAMFPGVRPVIEHYQESRNINRPKNQNRNFRVR